jgi:hypothetical protein
MRKLLDLNGKHKQTANCFQKKSSQRQTLQTFVVHKWMFSTQWVPKTPRTRYTRKGGESPDHRTTPLHVCESSLWHTCTSFFFTTAVVARGLGVGEVPDHPPCPTKACQGEKTRVKQKFPPSLNYKNRADYTSTPDPKLTSSCEQRGAGDATRTRGGLSNRKGCRH